MFENLLGDVFPGVKTEKNPEEKLVSIIIDLLPKYNLKATDAFIEKCLQVHRFLKLNHGLILVGPTGSGKTAVWKVVLEAN